jgi:peptidoglycan hydrolase CwlO-like protein
LGSYKSRLVESLGSQIERQEEIELQLGRKTTFQKKERKEGKREKKTGEKRRQERKEDKREKKTREKRRQERKEDKREKKTKSSPPSPSWGSVATKTLEGFTSLRPWGLA